MMIFSIFVDILSWIVILLLVYTNYLWYKRAILWEERCKLLNQYFLGRGKKKE